MLNGGSIGCAVKMISVEIATSEITSVVPKLPHACAALLKVRRVHSIPKGLLSIFFGAGVKYF